MLLYARTLPSSNWSDSRISFQFGKECCRVMASVSELILVTFLEQLYPIFNGRTFAGTGWSHQYECRQLGKNISGPKPLRIAAKAGGYHSDGWSIDGRPHLALSRDSFEIGTYPAGIGDLALWVSRGVN